MTAKEFLKQYEYAARRIRRLEEEYNAERLMIDAVRSLSDNDGMPHGSGISKPTEERAIRLADKLSELVDARFEAIELRREVFEVVQQVDGVPGDVLYARYIKLMKWEDVAEYISYSWKWTHHFHRIGLEIVSEILAGNKTT